MDYMKKMEILVQNLRKSQKVNFYNRPEEMEAETLAHSFLDMEESFTRMITMLFPKLLNDNINEKEIDETLFSIGEELRHILYHIKDPKFYSYLNLDE